MGGRCGIEGGEKKAGKVGKEEYEEKGKGRVHQKGMRRGKGRRRKHGGKRKGQYRNRR